MRASRHQRPRQRRCPNDRDAVSDEKLRELERLWKESGAVEDEAAYLLERVRVGDLTQERLELAAYCGQRGARAALHSGPQDWPDQTTEEWLRSLERFGASALVMASVAFAERAVEVSQAGDVLLATLETATRWAECPCTPHATAVVSCATRVRSEEPIAIDDSDREAVRYATEAVLSALSWGKWAASRPAAELHAVRGAAEQALFAAMTSMHAAHLPPGPLRPDWGLDIEQATLQERALVRYGKAAIAERALSRAPLSRD
jgi:hypothetical protein